MSSHEARNAASRSKESDASEAAELRKALDIALRAAREAERQLGTVEGERQRATMEWAAASMAQAEWDVELSRLREELRLSEERVSELTASLELHRQSRSWRLLQALLAPYRTIRRR